MGFLRGFVKSATRRQFLGKGVAVGGVLAASGLMKKSGFTAFAAEAEYDLLVIGSGAAGMTAALTAAHNGLRVLVVEKNSKFGGSSARSGGGIWIRNNRVLKESGIADSAEEAMIYLSQVAGEGVSFEKIRSFINYGPEVIDLITSKTPLSFRYMAGYSDYYPNFPGARPEGASIEPKVLNGNILGKELKNLNAPYIPTPTGVVIYGGDYKWLTLAKVTLKGIETGLKAAARFASAKLRGEKPLTMGQALAAGLRAGLLKARVPVWLNAPMQDLSIDAGGRVNGAIVVVNGRNTLVRARYGVLMASGGFEHNEKMRKQYQKSPIGTNWTVGAVSNTGDGILAGQKAGAELKLMDDAWWGPTIPLTKGQPYFCLSERSLPGSILVNRFGVRFTNESAPYHDVVNAMYSSNVSGKSIDTWLITDQEYRNRYLFKDVLPGLNLPKEWYASKAVVKADTIEDLAIEIGVSPEALMETICRFNRFADAGKDEDFHRGENSYDLYYSDPGQKPNPSLGRVDSAPFYAFKVVPGDLGTKGGLATDEYSRVLREDGSIIEGFYAAGNVSDSVMGRSYAGAGSTLGPAMVFGYVAALHVAGVLD